VAGETDGRRGGWRVAAIRPAGACAWPVHGRNGWAVSALYSVSVFLYDTSEEAGESYRSEIENKLKKIWRRRRNGLSRQHQLAKIS